jgi:hypothetical protein
METVEIVQDLWQKAEEFMHQAGTHMAVGHVGTKDDLYLIKMKLESKVSRTCICGVRATPTLTQSRRICPGPSGSRLVCGPAGPSNERA